MLFRWANLAYHPLTDQLLTIIEDKTMLRVAFGFNKGDTTSVPNNGNKIIDHCRDIARKLFIEPEGTTWTEDDVVKLGIAVKNRVNAYVLDIFDAFTHTNSSQG